MLKKMIIVIIAVVFVCGTVSFAEKVCGESEFVKIETPHPYPQTWTKTITRDSAGWLKIHFSRFRMNDEDCVVIKDFNGIEVERFYGSDIMDIENSRFKVSADESGRVSFWGPAINGPELTIEVRRGSDKRKGWGFTIDELGVGFEPLEDEFDDDIAEIESICGSDNKVSIACVASYYQNSGKSVGRMRYQKSGTWYVCTGFLVSSCSSHFLTNEHCITNQATVDTLEVRFNYRLSTCGGSNASYSTYYGNNFVKDNTTNDYCLLTLTGSPQNTYGYLVLLTREPYSGEGIYIPQHPGGRRQEIGFGTITNPNMRSSLDFGYYVDTEGGSSGSPVMTDQYDYDKVIGLHHYGGCPNSAVEINQIRSAIIGYICQ